MIREQNVADTAVVVSSGLVGFTWLGDLASVLNIVLSIAGIFAAITAARFHMSHTKSDDDE